MAIASRALSIFIMAAITAALPAPGRADSIHCGTVVMKFELGQYPSGKRVRLWIPFPQDGPYQEIRHVTVSGDFERREFTAAKGGEQKILYAEWGPGADSRQLNVSFDVVRKERRHREIAERGGLDPAKFAPYLTGSSKRPVDGVVKELADKITKGHRSPLEKARAVYGWVCRNMRRDPSTRGCGKGDVCLLLGSGAPAGKCADIHSVFVALLRAAGVPAREVFGLRLGRKGVTDITQWQHCWAEFWVPGEGWVAADPGDYLKWRLGAGLLQLAVEKVLHSKEKYYFGTLPPYRVGFGVGRDVALSPPQAGPPLNYFMYPYAEVDGEPLDPLAPETFRYFISHEAKECAEEEVGT